LTKNFIYVMIIILFVDQNRKAW